MNPNDDFAIAQLERELRSLEPLAPDPLLCARLERTLSGNGAAEAAPSREAAPSPRNVVAFSARRRWAPWAAAAAMAAVTGPYIWRNVQSGAAAADDQADVARTNKTAPAAGMTPQPRLVPMQTDKQIQRVSDGGMQYDNDRGLLRRLRFEYNTHQRYSDPSNGATLEVTFPSMEEVWIVEPVH